MREAEFREWLEDRGLAANAIATRIYAVRTIEQKLEELGFEDTDLDSAWSEGRIDAIQSRLSTLRADFAEGGEDFRILMPQSEKPDGRLSSWRSWLGQYRQFAAGESAPSKDADRIRQHALDAYIDPARERDEDHVDMVVKIVNDELGLDQAWPNICQALRGAKLHHMADVPPPQSFGADKSSATRFRFDLVPENYWALRTLRERFGKPISRTKKVAAFQLADGRQIALDLEASRAQVWIEGSVDRFDGINELVSYTPDQPRHSNLPNRLNHKSADARAVTMVVLPNEQVLNELLDRYVSGRIQKDTKMTDDQLLKRFDGVADFATARADWSQEQKASFCAMARAVHEAGLDWYPVQMAQIRFGRKEVGKIDALCNLGAFYPAQSVIAFHNQGPRLGLEGEYALDNSCVAEFWAQLSDASDEIAAWPLLRKGDRKPHWPDDYSQLAAEPRSSSIQTEATNLILYGPPGTGKTYRTATEAVRLCDGSAPADRTALMKRYHELRRKGRIGFVTFHQNYSYEDFVEGLRPQQTSQEDSSAGTGAGFSLVARDGIFKDIAKVAAENRGRALTHDLPPFDGSRKIFKMSLGRSWASEDDAIYQRALEGNYVVLGWGGDVDWSAPEYDDWEAIKRRWRQDFPDAHGNDPNMSQTYTFRANMEVGSLIVISDGNMKFRAIAEVTGPYRFEPDGEYNHRRAVRWLWHSDDSLPRERIYRKQLSQVSAYQMQSRQVEWDALEQIVATGGDAVETSGEPEPHVLVIDEINRANISKVFGELITLIEPDKRTGRENALTVTLPYSGDEFGVPANLHIIGTMNIADRSIAQLDTALRRRFRFEEIAPDPKLLEVVDGIDLPRVLAAMNERIEYLVDREHRIGHAFFMRCRSRAEIDAAMRDKVLPLLQEYFFDDWSRIAAIVGKGFVAGRTLRVPPGIDGGEDRISWSVRDPFAGNAYAILLGDETAPVTPEEGGPDHDPDMEA